MFYGILSDLLNFHVKRGKRKLKEFFKLQPGLQICRPNKTTSGGEFRVMNLMAERSFQQKKTFWENTFLIMAQCKELSYIF